MRILFTGGGTGGHFFPIIALMREIKRIAEDERILDLECYYMGPIQGRVVQALKEEGIVGVPIWGGKWRRYFSIQNFIDMVKTTAGIVQAVWNMFLIMPDVVFSKGGYGALPTVLAAALFRIPLMIHESDAIPGKVNLFSARFAKRIGIAFADAESFFPEKKTALVGIPIRKRILGGRREEDREALNIFSELPVVGFIGASQGAQKLNEAALNILKELADEYEVLHQTGETHYEEVRAEARVILESGRQDRYHPFGFLDEVTLRQFYSASDLIISRAGASSIFEIAVWGKPSILVPLPLAAQDHQRKNAYRYATEGAAVIIEEENLTPHILFSEIKKILGDPEKIKKMGEAAQRFANVNSAEVVAREILKIGIH